jgi:multicomponent Na+:H+ antiporter subunit F
MTGMELNPITLALNGSFVVLSVSLALSVWRLLRGPSLADRVVALDLIAILVIGMIAVDAVATGQASFLRVATVVALLAFLGTIAFARRLEKGGIR